MSNRNNLEDDVRYTVSGLQQSHIQPHSKYVTASHCLIVASNCFVVASDTFSFSLLALL